MHLKYQPPCKVRSAAHGQADMPELITYSAMHLRSTQSAIETRWPYTCAGLFGLSRQF